MACECPSQQGTLRIADGKKFAVGKSKVGNTNKIHLFKCEHCQQHWLVDEWEKFKERFAFKIKDATQWEKLDTTPMRKAYLVLSSGGTTKEVCSMKNCKGHRVKGSKLCVDHLYANDC